MNTQQASLLNKYKVDFYFLPTIGNSIIQVTICYVGALLQQRFDSSIFASSK